MNIKEIANLAGVSVATVSRVINGNSKVKPKIKEKVEQIIKENKYIPNTLGVSLRRNSSKTIGIILPIVHSYYGERFNAIATFSRQMGYSNLVSVSSYDESNEILALQQFLEKQVDGVIFMTTKLSKNHKEILDKYENYRPIVIMDYNGKDYSVPSITSDDLIGSKKAMDYLIENGHSEIGFISGNSLDTKPTKRLKVYKEYIKNLDLEELIIEGNFSLRSGYEAIDKFMKKYDKLPKAIFAENDSMIIGAAKRITELGFNIPEDVSLIGFDDIELLKYTNPVTISSIRQDLALSGEIAIKLLFELIKGNEVSEKNIVLEQNLIIRESVKNIKGIKSLNN